MNVETQAITDPMEQASKFVEIQASDERLYVLDESTRDAKKEL
jgi:hypothetical protein